LLKKCLLLKTVPLKIDFLNKADYYVKQVINELLHKRLKDRGKLN
jgi:hypothetical protein